jgi:hypothetical protein
MFDLLQIIFFLAGILLYLHIYIHFKTTTLNECRNLYDVSKESILSNIYFKIPFVFDGTSIIKNLPDTKGKIITKPYESLPMLEPSVRFFTNDTIYKLKKNKYIDIHRNLECRNFYILHSGNVKIYCIHPKYKDKLDLLNVSNISNSNDASNSTLNSNIDFIENNDVICMQLFPNSILFIPNYWYVYVKASEKSVVEKVQYKTILNEINFLYEKYSKSK